MKNIFYILLLLPTIIFAQYPSNSGQKITLGEQTTADGLVFRGVANDTNVITPFSDTSAYIILDTVNSKFYHYNRTTTYWSLAGGGGDSGGVTSFSAGTTGLTPSTATTGAVTLGGTLSVANGGTGSATQNFVDLTTTQSIGGAKTFTSAVTATRFNPTANTATGTGMYLPATNSLGFSTAGTQRIHINSAGKVGIGTQMTTAGTNDYGTLNVDGKLTFESEFFAYRSSGVETDGYSYFNLRDAGVSGSFGTGLTGQFEFYTYQGAGNINAFVIGNYQAKPFIIGTNAVERMRVTGDGEVWIGYTTDQGAYRLQVLDSVYVGGNVSASAYTTRSDYDLKDEIQNINYGLNEVMQMQPVKYTYKSNGSTQLGFIAQDLGVITPEVVSFEDKMSVYYNALIPILTKAIQEQNALIKALEQRILILENK